jgi:hypothetical protein
MTEHDVMEARRKRFHIANNPIRTLEDAREFLGDVGFCLVFPLRHPIQAPVATFIGAFLGTDEGLPFQQIAFADPRAREATELMVRLLRNKAAYEVHFHEDSPLLVSSEVFPFYYALVGEKTPKTPPKMSGSHKVSRLALDIYHAIEKHGPSTKSRLREQYLERGAALSDAGMNRALNELWSILKITRTDYSPQHGSTWDLLYRWAAEPLSRGARVSSPEALSATISRYVQGVIAAEEKEIEQFVAQFSSRSRAAEILRVLTGARELTRLTLEGRNPLLQVTEFAPMHPSEPEPNPKRPRPAVRRSSDTRGHRNG